MKAIDCSPTEWRLRRSDGCDLEKQRSRITFVVKEILLQVDDYSSDEFGATLDQLQAYIRKMIAQHKLYFSLRQHSTASSYRAVVRRADCLYMYPTEK